MHANPLKIAAMQRFGADMILAGEDFDAAKDAAQAYAKEHGQLYVEDGAHREIAEGAGTIESDMTRELMRRNTSIDTILVPLDKGALPMGVGAAGHRNTRSPSGFDAWAHCGNRGHPPYVPRRCPWPPPREGTNMNAEEHQLIADLFDRLRNVGAVEKDRDAEQLIISLARQNPDAGYLLVQNVLVQEQVVQQQQQELQAMQARVQQLEAMVQRPAAQAQAPASGNGGFLGGMFGGSRSQPSQRSSVPPVTRPGAQQASPWGRTSNAQGAAPYQQAPQAQAAPAAGGGFMRSAMATAAGVAGGMLAANAISNMMNGSSPSGASPAAASSDPGLGNNDPGTYAAAPEQTTSQDAYQDNNDPGTYSEPAPDTSWDGGGDVEL